MKSTTKRKYWSIISPNMPAAKVAELARQQESAGLAGTYSCQVYGPPFTALGAAATSTSRMHLATGIAIALTRSPFETAMAAIDLDHLSEGRFILGLGSSVKSWTGGIFGMPYEKPVAQLREAIEVIRKVIALSHTGTLTQHKGTYYQFDFSELQPPPPPLRTRVPIWIAALRGAMTQLGAEIGDGVIGHPVWTVDWLREVIVKDIKKGLDRSHRQRSDIEVNTWLWTTPNTDRRKSIEDARAVVAFYAGVAQYEPFFAAHGYAEVCKKLQHGVQQGSYKSVTHLVPDEMAERFVLAGTPDEVRNRLEPMWEFIDSVALLPPLYTLSQEEIQSYFHTIGETFYSDL